MPIGTIPSETPKIARNTAPGSVLQNAPRAATRARRATAQTAASRTLAVAF